jgi:putative IMPACT (imprinted ancient) family translation regulator
MFNSDQFSFDIGWDFFLCQDRVEYRDIIIDRKSKYTVVAFRVEGISEVKKHFKTLTSESYFRKASHNSYAYRVKQENGSIIEWKNDDGEQWAGMCILRELQREDATWVMIVVTRYFGWIQLHADRFKNVIDACKIFFEKEKKK